MNITRSELNEFVYLTKAAQCDYIRKERYRKLGRKILSALAKHMKLQRGEYDIRWNPGGVACSGDHTLHANWFYLALHDNCGLGQFYFRTCKGRKDYCGGANQIVYWNQLIEGGIRDLAWRIERGCPNALATNQPSPACYVLSPNTWLTKYGQLCS